MSGPLHQSTAYLDALAQLGALEARRQVQDLFVALDLATRWRDGAPGDIARSLADTLLRLLRLDLTWVHLRSPDGEILRVVWPAELDVERVRRAFSSGPAEEPVMVALPRPNTVGAREARAVAVTPHGEHGIVVVGSWRRNFPTPHEAALLRTVADQAGLAMQSSRERRAQRELAAERARLEALSTTLARLYAVADALGRAVARADVADVLLAEGRRAVGAAAVAVYVFDDDAAPESPACSLLRCTPDVAAPAAAAADALLATLQPAFAAAGLPVVACAPLQLQDRSFGAVAFGFEAGRGADAALLQVVAQQAAQALERSRLLDRERAARRDAEQHRDRATRLAEEARQADARKDAFLAMLGHELRNPLAPIVNTLAILEARDPAGLQQERVVIERHLGHVVRLVDDLLDVSRIARGQVDLDRGTVDVREVVARATEMVRPLLDERRHDLVTELPAEAVYVEGDPIRLAQVLGNLLQNAGKYSDPGGWIGLRVAAEASSLTIAVRDRGAGIPSELLPRLFQPFTQGERVLTRARGGLGLGLSIARSLVELHGGTLTAHSEGAGAGTEFVVRLPRAASPSAREPSAALEQGAPDVALVDIGLPGLDGYELARRVRAGGRVVRLIALTGYGRERDRRLALDAGFDEHLVKPVRLPALLALLGGAAASARLPA